MCEVNNAAGCTQQGAAAQSLAACLCVAAAEPAGQQVGASRQAHSMQDRTAVRSEMEAHGGFGWEDKMADSYKVQSRVKPARLWVPVEAAVLQAVTRNSGVAGCQLQELGMPECA